MSLINDALKQAQQQLNVPAGAPPLLPIEAQPRNGISWLLPILIVLLIATAALFLAVAFFPARKPAAQNIPPPLPVMHFAQAVIASPKPSPVTSQPVVATVPEKPSPPALKVQGIFINSAEPQAIVNGLTVYVGDSVEGFRVKLISKNNVLFIAPDGTEKSLGLGE
jgi:hypothetical protein